jgi:hypothetical protein
MTKGENGGDSALEAMLFVAGVNMSHNKFAVPLGSITKRKQEITLYGAVDGRI